MRANFCLDTKQSAMSHGNKGPIISKELKAYMTTLHPSMQRMRRGQLRAIETRAVCVRVYFQSNFNLCKWPKCAIQESKYVSINHSNSRTCEGEVLRGSSVSLVNTKSLSRFERKSLIEVSIVPDLKHRES